MNAAFKTLVAEALKLDTRERMEFEQLLQASLSKDAGLDEAWTIEIERRIADIENGIEQTIPMAEALAQVRKNLK
ncbi:addiction module protein [Duganella sp. HH101]|uniref:addiction module protein n=1 Tax=Duganella sp. HH101 TaxID=1781066 RepID=UPI00087563F4|nr:addiction module protein [Duganella sp. HH101]OFA01122.1 putative addiction module component [Duganella sp. HH101]